MTQYQRHYYAKMTLWCNNDAIIELRKASGPNQIPCCMLQELHEELTPVFTALFKNSYETGSLPAVWKSACMGMTPVFKKGTKCDASNYHPVSLICVACNLLEQVLCNHIHNHLYKYKALSPYQHGFRKKVSCESQLLMTSWSRPAVKTHREIILTAISGPSFHVPLHIFPPPPGPAGGPSRTWRGGSARWRHLM